MKSLRWAGKRIPLGAAVIYGGLSDEESQVIYMHCSAEGGQKIDNLRLHPDACITIVSQSELLPDKFATKYWSANVFGTVAIIEEGPEKQKGIEAILRKYSPEHV